MKAIEGIVCVLLLLSGSGAMALDLAGEWTVRGKDVEGVVVTLADGREVAPKSATIDGETFRIAVNDGQSVRAVRYNCFAYPERHVWSRTTGLPVAPFRHAFE